MLLIILASRNSPVFVFSFIDCFQQHYARLLFQAETVTMALITTQCQVANAQMDLRPYHRLTKPFRARYQQAAYTTEHSSNIQQQQHFQLLRASSPP
jgi:hypothetical protein